MTLERIQEKQWKNVILFIEYFINSMGNQKVIFFFFIQGLTTEQTVKQVYCLEVLEKAAIL